MLFVHRPGRDVARVTRTVGAAVITEDQRDGSVQHKNSRIEPVRVSLAMLVWFDFAFSDFVTLPLAQWKTSGSTDSARKPQVGR
jgi:hypothetical protein